MWSAPTLSWVSASRVAALALVALTTAPPAPAQEPAYPPISARQFTAGSIEVSVTGSQNIAETIPINAQASIGDGGFTWLQFGASGSESPNSLITFTDMGEVGVSVGKGKFIVTAGVMPGEKPQCEGKTEVTPTLITGKYTCRGITSHDAATDTMGKVDVVVAFTATS